jgi:hypothetical protein
VEDIDFETIDEAYKRVRELNRLITHLVLSLEDCASYSGCDDVNGEAGLIAEKALKEYERLK